MDSESKFEPQGYCPKCNYRMNPGVCTECGEQVDIDKLLDKPTRRLGRFVLFANRHSKVLFYLNAAAIALLILSILMPTLQKTCHVRPPKMQELTGEWIAINESRACLYRFELLDDGTGTIVCQQNDGHRDAEPYVSRITYWRVRGRDIEINLEPNNDQFLPTILKGRVVFSTSILLNELEGGRGNFAKELSLIREADVVRSLQTTRDAMSNGLLD
ncbi:MAG: hypothetical protein KDA54_10930 [Phycisphaerales bacterium]|nr:hypothetical protein [Phycisphaerales bacterium]